MPLWPFDKGEFLAFSKLNLATRTFCQWFSSQPSFCTCYLLSHEESNTRWQKDATRHDRWYLLHDWLPACHSHWSPITMSTGYQRANALVQAASLDSQLLVLVQGLLRAILIDSNGSSITKQIVIILSPSPVSQHHFEIISLKPLELADGLTKRPIMEQMEKGERCFPLTPDGEQV